MALRQYIEDHQVLFVFFVGIVAVAAWYMRYVIALAFSSYIIATGMHVLVVWLEERRWPRWAAIALVYSVLACLLMATVYFVSTSLAANVTSFASEFPNVVNRFTEFTERQGMEVFDISRLFDTFRNLVMQGVTGGASALFGVVLAFVASIYVITRWYPIHTSMINAFGPRYSDQLRTFFTKVEHALGHWIIGQLSLSVIVGTLTFVGLTLLGVPFAMVLAVFAGLMEIVPNIGPMIAAVPAILIAFSMSSTDALLVIGLYIVVQQLENNLITPLIMKRAVQVDPLLVIFGTLTGLTVAGVIGALLAVPLIKVAQIAWATFMGNITRPPHVEEGR